MEVREALAVLELDEGADGAAVRRAYLRLVRLHHPDVAGPDEAEHLRTSRLIEAHEALLAHLDAHGADRVMLDDRPGPRASDVTAAPPPGPSPAASHRAPWPAAPPVGASVLDEDTIAVDAPPDETFAALYEAASVIGDIAYVDRQLLILETIVRFEGGPSCSVVMTLQGRAHHTEVFCSMESIEAAPTPAIAPVITALTAQLAGDPA